MATKKPSASASNAQNAGMSASDQEALKAAGDAWNAAHAAGDQAAMDAAHAQAEAIRNNYGYSGGKDGSGYISTGSSGSSSGGSSGSSSNGSSGRTPGSASGDYVPADNSGIDYGKNTMTQDDYAALKAAGDAWNKAYQAGNQAAMDAAHAQAEAIRGKYNYSGGQDGSEFIQSFTQPGQQVPDFSGLLNSWLEQAKEQQQAAIDYAVDKGVADLERAEADAQEQFQVQQNQVDENEAKALDNQALYAEARGDRGGIGQAQYGQIQATAMENRRAINSARVKLSTDTARQIADLRAQGEFQKADALLQLTQTYLSQLIQMQQWGAEYSLSVQQFNAQLQQWQKEFDLSVGSLMGEYNGQPTLEAQQIENNRLVESGMAALSVGVRPSAAQQAAMGYTDDQITAILAEYKLSKAASGSSGGGSRGSSGSGSSSANSSEANVDVYRWLLNSGATDYGTAYRNLRDAGYDKTDADRYAKYYEETYYPNVDWDEIERENATVDLNSVLSLGYGPISGSKLAQLEESGAIESYVSNGKIYYRKKETKPMAGWKPPMIQVQW